MTVHMRPCRECAVHIQHVHSKHIHHLCTREMTAGPSGAAWRQWHALMASTWTQQPPCTVRAWHSPKNPS